MLKKCSKRKTTNNFFKYLYVGFLTLLLVLILGQEWRIYQVQKAIDGTQIKREELVEKQAKLETEIKNLNDLKYVEKVARSQYKLIKPNEIPIVIREE